MHRRGGTEHGRVKVGAAYGTWPTQDKEKEFGGLDQD